VKYAINELDKTNYKEAANMEQVFAQGIIIIGTSAAILGLSGKVKRLCRSLLCRGV